MQQEETLYIYLKEKGDTPGSGIIQRRDLYLSSTCDFGIVSQYVVIVLQASLISAVALLNLDSRINLGAYSIYTSLIVYTVYIYIRHCHCSVLEEITTNYYIENNLQVFGFQCVYVNYHCLMNMNKFGVGDP